MTGPKRQYVRAFRVVLLALSLCTAVSIILRHVHAHYPIEKWLFWTYAKLWLWCGLFASACVSCGYAIMHRVGPRMPLRERLVFSAAVGTLAFFCAMFLGGVLRLYGRAFSIALPVTLLFAGALSSFRHGRRVVVHLRAAMRRKRDPPPWWRLPVLAFGLLGLGLTYFAILSPRNIAFDSHFYHLALAQQYVVEGAILPAREAWLPAALPQLASVLYTWSFMVPGLSLAERVLCAAHLEFVIFLFTLAGMPVLVRWLAPGSRSGLSWVAIFLFPGILVYDSNLGAAADHVAALWAIPSYLALRRAWSRLSPRCCALLAAVLAGALLTKYQAMYILAFPALAVIVRSLWLCMAPSWILRTSRTSRLAPLRGVFVALVVGLVLTAPHWLKNWIWYGDPLFPYLHAVFKPTQWAPDLGQLFADWSGWQLKRWTFRGTLSERLFESLKITASFSFSPHDWPKFHGKVPIFGFLFTLAALLLPFLQRTRRTWGLLIATNLAVFVWAYTMHQDRYLQAVLPWMAVVVAATISLAWAERAPIKILVGVLVGVQVVWGGDVYFLSAHAMTRKSPAIVTSSLLGMGHKKKYANRLVLSGSLSRIGAAPELPKAARVLIHEHNGRLGLWRPVVGDSAGWQYALRYELMESRAAFHDKLRSMGVTHIVSRPQKSRQLDSLGADLRFFDYLRHVTKSLKSFGGFRLYRLPDEAPAARRMDVVAYLGCDRFYGRGLHSLRDLHVRQRQVQKRPPKRKPRTAAPRKADQLAAFLAKADFVVVGNKCRPKVPAKALRGFTKIAALKKEQLWSRK